LYYKSLAIDRWGLPFSPLAPLQGSPPQHGTYQTVKARLSRHMQDSHGQHVAHIRQSWPDYGLGFQVNVLEMIQVVAISVAVNRFKDFYLKDEAKIWP